MFASRAAASRPLSFLLIVTLLALPVLLLRPAAAVAERCGDDVDGRRVACACGDTVVSDTRLLPADPVTHGRCPLDGLTVSAPPSAESITVDLAGLSIVGNGVGTGLRVRSGGTDGAVIIGGRGGERGEIVHFGTGIKVSGALTVRRIAALEVKGNRRDGLLLRTAGMMVLDVIANNNGANGIRVSGQGGRLLGIEASGNHAAGVRLFTRGTILAGEAVGNGHHGVVAHGARNDLSGLVSTHNSGHGVLLGGYRHNVEGLVVEENALADLAYTNR